MAVFIEANYSKKIGLPAYSSHSFSVTLRSEVSELKDVDREASKLYAILQGAVDAQIVESGFTPEQNGNGSPSPRKTNGHSTDQPRSNDNSSSSDREFKCSDKQRDFFLRFIEEKKLDKRDVEKLSQELFNAPVLTLDKLAMSGLIENLLQTYGDAKGNNSNGRRYQRGVSRQ
jgi:hypothetical protein